MALEIPDPADHRRKVEESEEGYYHQLNEYLKAAVARAKTKSFDVSPLPGIPWAIRDDVFKAWRAAGWQISYQSDQREGDWIRISA